MELLAQLLPVGIVLGVLVFLAWLLRRGGAWKLAWNRRSSRNRMLESLERLPLSPNHTLHLIRVGDRRMLIAAHASGCSLMGQDRPQGGALEPVRTNSAGELS